MDQMRFDRLTRTMAISLTRRRVLPALAVGVAAAFSRHGADASCAPDQVKRRGVGCVCQSTGRPPDAAGECDCPSGHVMCDSRCLDVSKDPANCGGCGRSCDDGDACTCDSCRDGQCRHQSIVCESGDACGVATCDPAVGCIIAPLDCSAATIDACTLGVCDPAIGCVSVLRSCDDGDICTADSCDPVSGCVHTSIDCDDGDACTVDRCDPIDGCLHAPLDCDDGNACMIDTCHPDSGCS